MKIKLLAAALAVGVFGLAGCATITEGRHQTITVNTNPAGASCVFNREKDGQIATIDSTPGGADIRKTKYDITIVCNKPGYQQATFLNHSDTESMTFGNAIIGGAIGWGIDSATGSDNKYTSPVNVTLVPNTAPADASAQTSTSQSKPADKPAS